MCNSIIYSDWMCFFSSQKNHCKILDKIFCTAVSMQIATVYIYIKFSIIATKSSGVQVIHLLRIVYNKTTITHEIKHQVQVTHAYSKSLTTHTVHTRLKLRLPPINLFASLAFLKGNIYETPFLWLFFLLFLFF